MPPGWRRAWKPSAKRWTKTTLAERLETVALQQELARAYRASEGLLREKNRVSFGSLITGTVGLLERDAQLREGAAKKIPLHPGG